MNVFVFVPAATVTDDGTVAAAVFPLESVTTFPPVGAFALRVTVPVELVPPVTLVGLSDTAERFCATDGRDTTAARTTGRHFRTRTRRSLGTRSSLGRRAADGRALRMTDSFQGRALGGRGVASSSGPASRRVNFNLGAESNW